MTQKRIPLSVPVIEGNEWTYVKECLDSGWVSSVGSYVDKFENSFASFTGSKYAIACVNGTAAIHIALKLVGVNSGDEVVVPTLTFIAPVNVINYCNATPVFVDCDRFYNVDPQKFIQFIKQETIFKDGSSYNKKTGARIGAFLPVHVFGNAVDFELISDLCTERGIPIVEDATESLGTRYVSGKMRGKHTGTIGKLGCFSFNGNKIITTGGGGMIITDDEVLAAKARYLTTQAKNDAKRFVHDEVGYNYRLTNVLAAIGVAQLERISTYLEIKQRLFNAYLSGLRDIPGLKIAEPPTYAKNNLWMFPVQIDPKEFGHDREGVMARLDQIGIETRPVWQLNHLQKPYTSCQAYDISEAIALISNTLNIPCSVNLSSEDQQFVIDNLRALCG